MCPSSTPSLTPAALASLRARVSRLDQAVTTRGQKIRAVAPRIAAPVEAPSDERPLLLAMVGAQGLIVVLALVATAVWLGREGPPPEPDGDALVAEVAEIAAVAEPDPDDASVDGTNTGNAVADTTADDAVADAVAVPPALPPEGAAPSGSTPPISATIAEFPAELFGDTRSSTVQRAERYSCAPERIEGGSEVWYEVVVPERGLLTAWLPDEPRRGIDVDVHLLSRPDPEHCVDRGHTAVSATLEPGTYWLVVDTFTGGRDRARPGPYALRVTLAPR